MTSVAQKLILFVRKGPFYHYTYGSWRAHRWLAQRFSSPKSLLDSDIAQQLIPASFANHTGSLDWNFLLHHFKHRTAPRFFFGSDAPAEVAQIVAGIDQAAQEKTIEEADKICAGEFEFRGESVSFPHQIDWQYAPHGNVDWMWDLNRHVYFETLGKAYRYTGDERYAQKFRALLLDWLHHNPAHVGQANWSSVFEVAFRINTWLWAFHLFIQSPSFDGETLAAFLKGIWAHGDFLNRYIELHARNNHVLLEAKALAMLGILFPEFKQAAHWQKRGLALFLRELREQVGDDGVHGERAMHYHRVIAGELLELLVLLEQNNVEIPADILATLARMVDFQLWATKPNGEIPLLGDSALEDVHLRFSGVRGAPVFLQRADLAAIAPPPTEAERWLLGLARVQKFCSMRETPHADSAQIASRAFAEGGYFIMRAGEGPDALYLNFDCGPFGYAHDQTHGHADALSLELYAHGRTWLLDPGVYSTHLGWKWRKYFRGTLAHNTITIEGADQSQLLDSRRVYRPARATLHRWHSTEASDFVDGSHDGYQRLTQPVTHRRQIFFAKPDYWIVIDTLTGEGEHEYELGFHFPPDVKVHVDEQTGKACVTDQSGAALQAIPLSEANLSASVIAGQEEPPQGWVSFYSGEKVAAPALIYAGRNSMPLQICTVLHPQRAGASGQTSARLIPVIDIDQNREVDDCLGICVENDSFVDYVMLAANRQSSMKRFGPLESDATLHYARFEHGSDQPIRRVSLS